MAFSPDGTNIVSGSDDKTIKVWDAINFRPHVESEWGSFDKTLHYAEFSDEEDEVETWWRNKITGQEERVKPSRGKRLPWNPRRSKAGIRVRRELKIAPPWPKLTPVGLSDRRAGAAEREDERPQRHHLVGGIFPGWNQDCVGIARQDDQSLGFGCAFALKIAPPWPKLMPVGLPGRQAGAVEREDECPQ